MAPKAPFTDMDPKFFLPGYEINETELQGDALGREMIRRLTTSGILPLFNKGQFYIIPSFVDQFYSSAVLGDRVLSDGTKIKCLVGSVEGFDISIDHLDIRSTYGFHVSGCPMEVDQEVLDATAQSTVNLTSLSGYYKKKARR